MLKKNNDISFNDILQLLHFVRRIFVNDKFIRY